MKKLFISVSALVVVALMGIYVFIPAKITFSKVIYIKTKVNIANRFLMDESKWGKWFPSDSVNNPPAAPGKNIYKYKDYFYSIENTMMNLGEVSITDNHTLLKSLINIISINGDSVGIEWKSKIPESSNPVNRIRNYKKAKELQNSMADILKHLQTFLEKKENVYGLDIIEMKVTDTLFISIKYKSAAYPSIPTIYSLIKNLREYILKEGAEETNYPIMNIIQDSDSFRTIIAIPINKIILEENNFVLKRMVPGKILVTEVTGGNFTTGNALKQLDMYRDDNHLSSPALPFQSLVTDRSREPDTAKWVTKIYYPIY
jgi:DNA-directed RNA polymerase subunit L